MFTTLCLFWSFTSYAFRTGVRTGGQGTSWSPGILVLSLPIPPPDQLVNKFPGSQPVPQPCEGPAPSPGGPACIAPRFLSYLQLLGSGQGQEGLAVLPCYPQTLSCFAKGGGASGEGMGQSDLGKISPSNLGKVGSGVCQGQGWGGGEAGGNLAVEVLWRWGL